MNAVQVYEIKVWSLRKIAQYGFTYWGHEMKRWEKYVNGNDVKLTQSFKWHNELLSIMPTSHPNVSVYLDTRNFKWWTDTRYETSRDSNTASNQQQHHLFSFNLYPFARIYLKLCRKLLMRSVVFLSFFFVFLLIWQNIFVGCDRFNWTSPK